MLLSVSPRLILAGTGLVLVLGPVALIQIYRGLAAPVDAGVIASVRPVGTPAAESLRRIPQATPSDDSEAARALLFQSPGVGPVQTFISAPEQQRRVAGMGDLGLAMRFDPRAPVAPGGRREPDTADAAGPAVSLRGRVGGAPFEPAIEAPGVNRGTGHPFEFEAEAPDAVGRRRAATEPGRATNATLRRGGMFEFSEPSAMPETLPRRGSRVGAADAVAPPPATAKRRERVTRSATCDGKMPEDSWLDICG